MANIWYVAKGTLPSGNPRCQLTFEKYQQLFGTNQLRFLGANGPNFPTSNPNLDGYRGAQYVVLQLVTNASTKKKGFYLLYDVTPTKCEEILKGQGL
ncbi:MAG TPA: hypothetical protein VMW23_07120 [Sedimentisphaerales bacterium]|nr:hypothetical protein [Sedimentisphaerales bacterium]